MMTIHRQPWRIVTNRIHAHYQLTHSLTGILVSGFLDNVTFINNRPCNSDANSAFKQS